MPGLGATRIEMLVVAASTVAQAVPLGLHPSWQRTFVCTCRADVLAGRSREHTRGHELTPPACECPAMFQLIFAEPHESVPPLAYALPVLCDVQPVTEVQRDRDLLIFQHLMWARMEASASYDVMQQVVMKDQAFLP